MCNKFHLDKDFNITINECINSEVVYVYILQHLFSDGKYNSKTIIKEDNNQKVVFKTDSDGFYVLLTVIVPKDSTNYFYYNNGKFYKNVSEVSVKEIIETNPHLSNITILYDYYFLTSRLKKCFVDICYNIFNTKQCSKNRDNELVYKRDLIQSALNVLEYLVEVGQYKEAQRLLEELTSCNGICQKHKKCKCHE